MAVLMLVTLNCTAFADAGGIGIEPGQTMPDFTVSLTDGTTATLSELLKEKDLVVLNVFATWCGPCEKEFPEMEKTYQAHSDRMVILSVSGDPDDTMEMLADYQSGHALSFLMGQAGEALDFLEVSSFPTTMFIDRDRRVGFVKVGAFLNENEFEEKVGTFLSADYDGIPLPSEIAHSYTRQILGLILGAGLLLVIGRWLLFRKAGKPGWHSIIPILSTYQEYSLGWKGWIGILTLLFPVGAILFNLVPSHPNWSVLCSSIFWLVYFVLRLVESLKLAKAFGKGTGLGILMAVIQSVGRFGLGVSKAKYQGCDDGASPTA